MPGNAKGVTDMAAKLTALFLAAVALPPAAISAAPINPLHVGERLPRADLLTPSVQRFVRYNITADGRRSVIDIWTRDLRHETRDGQPMLHLHQQWDEVSPAVTVVQDSWFEPGTFRPIGHSVTVTKDGKSRSRSYDFRPDKVVGSDVPDNAAKDFSQALSEPVYNWEADTELLQALPLAAGYSASIPFYDVGQDPPGRYVYAVVGSEIVPEADGRGTDAWIVRVDFPKDKVSRRFWFAKASHRLLREELNGDDGTIEVKSPLAAEPPPA
jgi:hypothetical protein